MVIIIVLTVFAHLEQKINLRHKRFCKNYNYFYIEMAEKGKNI